MGLGLRRLPQWAYVRLPAAVLGGRALPVLRLNLTVTLRCNLKCGMCLQREEWDRLRCADPQAVAHEMTAAEIHGVIAQVPPRLAIVGFCGGEIFLRPDMMSILAAAARRNPVGFVTNATLVTPEVARDLVRMRVRSILVSLDGGRAEHDAVRGVPGTFDRALAGLEALLRARRDAGARLPEIAVNSVVTARTLGSLPGLFRTLAGIGVGHVALQMLDVCAARFQVVTEQAALYRPPVRIDPPLPGLQAEIAGLVALARELGLTTQLKPQSTPAEFADYYVNRMDTGGYFCTFPWKQVILSPYGDVYPCYMLSMGNVRRQRLAEIWNGEEYRSFRRAVRKHRLLPQCSGCCFMEKR